VRRSIAVAAFLIAAATLATRASRTAPDPFPPSRPATVLPLEPAPTESEPEEVLGRFDSDPADVAEMLHHFPTAEILHRWARQGPLEQGFSVLRQRVAENDLWRQSILERLVAADVDEETKLFALRLLPPFERLSDVERSTLTRLLDRPPPGELGRQFVRYVATTSWLSRILEQSEDVSVKAEALRGLARCRDPIAESILRRWLEDPDAPAALNAGILSTFAVPSTVSRPAWLPDALEKILRLRPGDPLALRAAAILGQAGDPARLSCLLESEQRLSVPEERALIAFGLRWLPGDEAAATLARMASNPNEAPDVRRIAVESLRGRKSPAVVERLRWIESEPEVSPDLKSALESLLRE
jgi:hypothetical protein